MDCKSDATSCSRYSSCFSVRFSSRSHFSCLFLLPRSSPPLLPSIRDKTFFVLGIAIFSTKVSCSFFFLSPILYFLIHLIRSCINHLITSSTSHLHSSRTPCTYIIMIGTRSLLTEIFTLSLHSYQSITKAYAESLTATSAPPSDISVSQEEEENKVIWIIILLYSSLHEDVMLCVVNVNVYMLS